jgi:hypothetical protein
MSGGFDREAAMLRAELAKARGQRDKLLEACKYLLDRHGDHTAAGHFARKAVAEVEGGGGSHVEPAVFGWTRSGHEARKHAKTFGESADDGPEA